MNRSWLLFLFIGIMGMNNLQAQEVMDLYPGKIPGAKTAPAAYKETETIRNGKVFGLSKVFNPTLSLYKPDPDHANGTAVIICPGGGYAFLATDHEGEEVARKLAGSGVMAFVLKYRLPNDTIMVDKKFTRTLLIIYYYVHLFVPLICLIIGLVQMLILFLLYNLILLKIMILLFGKNYWL